MAPTLKPRWSHDRGDQVGWLRLYPAILTAIEPRLNAAETAFAPEIIP
jgi:hypothetical protein